MLDSHGVGQHIHYTTLFYLNVEGFIGFITYKD